MSPQRTVFFVSDGTGITAEMLGHSLLTQFEGVQFDQVTLPFVDSLARAEECRERIAAAMANAIPVLPLVASISVSPGFISPRCSARAIIDSAGLSFTEPAGLFPSSLASSTLLVSPGMRFRRTSGVFPTKFSRD
jgi:hypothetical protein